MMLMSAIDILLAILIVVAVGIVVITLVIAIGNKNNSKIIESIGSIQDSFDSGTVELMVANTVRDALDQEVQELAKTYAEERRLIQWIEELSAKGELDIEQISTAAKKRAYALAIKKAEEAVTLAEGSLAECKEKIFDEQRELFNEVRMGYTGSLLNSRKEHLKELTKQEKILKERLESIREKLASLTELQ